MTTIYVDSCKRVAGSDSDSEVDLGESRRLQDSTGSTPRLALLPKGRTWAPGSNFATATYSKTTNSLSVAYDGNRLILNDLDSLRYL